MESQCHKPTMTGGGVYMFIEANKKMVNGMVYDLSWLINVSYDQHVGGPKFVKFSLLQPVRWFLLTKKASNHGISAAQSSSQGFIRNNFALGILGIETISGFWILAGWWLGHPKNMTSSIGMMRATQLIWENKKWQPNHQPACILTLRDDTYTSCTNQKQMRNIQVRSII